MEINFKKLQSAAKPPCRANESDAGYDLFASEACLIKPMERRLVSIGVSISIPKGYYGRIAPRSGLAIKRGIDVLAGVIDSGYRDCLRVVLINLNLPDELFIKNDPTAMAYDHMFGSKKDFRVSVGDRVAQIIIEKCYEADWSQADTLSNSDRGVKGFGSSGK